MHPCETRSWKKHRRLLGVSLIETVLALAIGGVVIASSVAGMNEYSESIRVKASATMMNRLARAADRYAADNYDDLIGPDRELDISVLEPYLGPNIESDAMGSRFVLSTHTYQITVPDPAGGTMTQNALQLLVVAKNTPNSQIRQTPLLAAKVASAAGNGAGFISQGDVTCLNRAGTGTRGDGAICGAFGEYSFGGGRFSATNFNNATHVALVTTGDSTLYGDQLYRYDYGDPELNTMHTDLHMNDNRIEDASRITGVDVIEMDRRGAPSRIRTSRGHLDIAPSGRLELSPGGNRILLNDADGNGGDTPLITTSHGRLQLGDNGNLTEFGSPREVTSGGSTRRTGSGDVRVRDVNSRTVRAQEFNSLFNRTADQLRLQNQDNGEIVVGKRIRYRPDGRSNGGVYDIADGEIYAQHVRVQDITCADCGGTLSQILPRWRHMGTYYISRSNSGTRVNKPKCEENRRDLRTRDGFNETREDSRYEPKIILVPKHLYSANDAANTFTVEYNFWAEERSTHWIAYPETQGADATALAMTYCVFMGGDTPDPTVSATSSDRRMQTSPTSNWRRLD